MFPRTLLLLSFIAAVFTAPSLALAVTAKEKKVSSSYDVKLCEIGVWKRLLAVQPQSVELVDTYEVGGKTINAYKFGEIKGQYGKLFLFGEVKDGCFVKVISFGSYKGANERALKFGAIKGEQRAYHIDEYTGGGHSTIRMGPRRYNFKQAWKVAKRYF